MLIVSALDTALIVLLVVNVLVMICAALTLRKIRYALAELRATSESALHIHKLMTIDAEKFGIDLNA